MGAGAGCASFPPEGRQNSLLLHFRGMPQDVPEDYFRRGVFARAAPGELFGRYTCVPCGQHSKTWEAFRAHRRECLGYPMPAGGRVPQDAAQEEEAA